MLYKLIVVLGALWIVNAQAGEPVVVSAALVNSAGEQRMLSQRIAKAYVQLGLEVLPAAALEQLRDAIVRFELNLERLDPAAAALESGPDLVSRLGEHWRGLRTAADRPVTKDHALEVSRRSIEVLASAEALTALLERANAHEPGRRVNLAGRQRMLSQRLAKAFMLYSWGVQAADNRRELDEATRQFDDGLAALNALPDNGPEAQLQLEEIALQWEWLKTALAVEGALSYRLVVAEASESILVATDRLTQLYERAAE